MGKYADEYNRKRKNLMAKIARLKRGVYFDENSPYKTEFRAIIPEDIVPPKRTKASKKDIKELDQIIEGINEQIQIEGDIRVRDDYENSGNIYLDPFTGEQLFTLSGYLDKKTITITYAEFLSSKRKTAYAKGQATKHTKQEKWKESIEKFNKLKSQIYDTQSEIIGESDYNEEEWQNRVKELENIIADYNGKKQIDNTAKSNFSPPSEGEINRFKNYDDGIKKQQEYYAQANKQYTDESHLEFTLTFDNVYSRLSEYEPQAYWGEWFNNVKREDTEKARNILNHAIVEIGIDNVARNIQANALEIDDLIDRIKYGSGGGEKYDTYRSEVKADLVKLQELLLGRKLSLTESIYWTEVSEEGESEY